jgi:prepilin-type N-terminal cleavage/methylation domain-containing protein
MIFNPPIESEAKPWLRLQKNSHGFSLIEMLVTVSILTLIILGLVAMFDQTRKAFTSSVTQVDVLESGRAAADIVSREVEQMAAVGATPTIPKLTMYNFYLDSPLAEAGGASAPLVQSLIDPNDLRTNNLQRIYYVTQNNRQWSSVGYEVIPANINDGIGTLYRFGSTNIPYASLYNVLAQQSNFFRFTPPTNGFSRIIDGVVDFRVRVLNANGSQYPIFCLTNSLGQGLTTTPYTNSLQDSTVYVQPAYLGSSGAFIGTGDQYSAEFVGQALPAYVEIELGILEDRALARYHSLTNSGGNGPGTLAWSYLTNHAGQVHVFRQRIAIHNYNPQAFQ